MIWLPLDVIAVVMAVQKVLDRQGADRLDRSQHVGSLNRELVVDKNQTSWRHADGDVSRFVNKSVTGLSRTASGHARKERAANHVEALLHLVGTHRRLFEDFDILFERELLRQDADGERAEQGGQGKEHGRSLHRSDYTGPCSTVPES